MSGPFFHLFGPLLCLHALPLLLQLQQAALILRRHERRCIENIVSTAARQQGLAGRAIVAATGKKPFPEFQGDFHCIPRIVARGLLNDDNRIGQSDLQTDAGFRKRRRGLPFRRLNREQQAAMAQNILAKILFRHGTYPIQPGRKKGNALVTAKCGASKQRNVGNQSDHDIVVRHTVKAHVVHPREIILIVRPRGCYCH